MRMIASTTITMKKLAERCIITVSPCSLSREGRISEDQRSESERDRRPRPRHPEHGGDEHAETRRHAQGRDDDFADRDGGAALANSPREYREEAQDTACHRHPRMKSHCDDAT